MKMFSSVSGISKVAKKVLAVLLFLVSADAFSWSAINLGGGNWAIICANGTAWSYSGSSAGLDVVGPALCPAGIYVQEVPRNAKGAEKGLNKKVNHDVLANKKEVGDNSGSEAKKTYPPHGYPCLGCQPCPGNPTEFCDNGNLRIVVPAPLQCTGGNPGDSADL